jgi:hypothetical protein
MARRTLEEIRQDGHSPRFSRQAGGYSPFGRPVYVNSVTCECGWKWGGRIAKKSEAVQAHNDHLREES